MKKNYRKIWSDVHGEIPKDNHNRPYEIHHIDGNHHNNDIENLKCVSIDEHYKLHYENGDFGACVLIAKRMNESPTFLSEIQKGKKRPGVGGVKKGTIPWNKNKKGYKLELTEFGKNKKIAALKNRSIITDILAKNIRTDFANNIPIEDEKIGKIGKNGVLYTYERAFCKKMSNLYGVSEQYIYRILRNKSKNV